MSSHSGRRNQGRPELVARLKRMTVTELAAYCTGVLDAWAEKDPRQALAMAMSVDQARNGDGVKQSVKRKPAGPILCRLCRREVPRSGKAGRPRTVHEHCKPGKPAPIVDLRDRVAA